jgi:hypothetical protein
MKARTELLIAASLLVFGVAVLPALIFVVGITVVGPYEGENGLGSLYAGIIDGLGRPEPAAWVLVLGPYVAVQCLRLAFFRRRSPAPVTPITK